MKANIPLIILSLFTFLFNNNLFAQQEVTIYNTSKGTCKVYFVDDIFDTDEDIITVSSAQFAAINDEIEVICDTDANCVGPAYNGACILVIDPVCGCNGLTYSNSCFANLDGIYTYYKGSCPPDTNGDDPFGIVGSSKRRKRTKGRKAISQGEDPSLNSCYVDYNWEWTITDYNEETLAVLNETTLTKKFRVIDTDDPEIYLLPNPLGDIPLEFVEDNTSAEITNTILYHTGMIQWEAEDNCGNKGITTLNPSIGIKKNWYADFDKDGYGNPDIILKWGVAPPNYVSNSLDCDDTDFLVNPDSEEISGNAVDENCDGDYGEINCFWDTQRISDVQVKGNFGANYLLESDAKLPSGANVIFQSAENITLMPGFTAQAGSNFTAQISLCEAIPFLVESEERSTEEKIERVEMFTLKAYPNPIKKGNPLQIDFALPTTEKGNITLYNVFGTKVKEVIQSKVYGTGKHQLNIPTDNLTNGMYMIRLQSGTKQLTQKLLIID